MGDDRHARTFDLIVRVVLEILASKGYDAVQLRVVAERAGVSLTTIYKHFATRDDLIVTAVGRWMQEHCYAGLVDYPSDASLYEWQMWLFRQLFQPWERCPRMLEAYHRARIGPGGERLDMQGMAAAEPAARVVLEIADQNYAKDFRLIMTNMVSGVIQRCAAGHLEVKEILPVLERTLFRLTTNNEHLAVSRTPRELGIPRLEGLDPR